MKKILISSVITILSLNSITAQKYEFKTVKDLEQSNIKSQGNTGTCWSFSTTSFLESEVIRLTGKKIDLSEMYTVRNTYLAKASNYLYRQGKAQFSQGGLAHDVINSVKNNGVVPEKVFSGLSINQEKHDHSELVAVLKSTLDTYIKKPAKVLSPKWKKVTKSILNIYLGENKKEFTFEDKKYTPKSFAQYLKINPSDYLSITSFTHKEKYKKFILNIPDNFSNGTFYNVSLDELVKLTERAIQKGYTLALDCDVSEKTFSSDEGIAFIPDNIDDNKKGLKEIVKEKEITPILRQSEFENFNTTDDHLMHIVGLIKDQKGNKYFKVKNSWGSKKGNQGYIYMSFSYFKLKAISVLIHKDAIKRSLKKKFKI